LPAVVVGAGLAVELPGLPRTGPALARRLLARGLIYVFLAGIILGATICSRKTSSALPTSGLNPFSESPVIGEFLNKSSGPQDTVAVLGSEAQIYYYSRRRAATGYIYTYGLMDGQPYNRRMQTEMTTEIENSGPKFLVVVNSRTSWLSSPQADQWIITWINDYTKSRYHLVGIADIRGDGTVYRWHGEAAAYQPSKKTDLIFVFEKK
jgi:hypothetical protein